MPTASINAYIVVGPTKAKPFLRRAFDSALDSSETVGTSEWSSGPRRVGGLEAPDEVDEAALVAQGDGGPGVGDGRLDLAAVADDAGVAEQPLDVGVGVGRDDVGVEVGEGGAEVRALAQDRRPRQAGLEALEADPLVEAALVADRHAPLGVVVVHEEGVDRGPRGAGEPVSTNDRHAATLGQRRRMTTRGKPPETASVSAALVKPARSKSERVPTYAIVRSTFAPRLSTG